MTHDTSTQSSDRLDQIIAGQLQAEEAGEAPPLEQLMAAHPEHAEGLRNFFANRDEVAAALPREPPRPVVVPPNLRYVGNYELLEEIARGGMGVVYKARQTTLNRIVAVKLILAGQLAGEEDIKRFLFGSEETAQLKHPGIVPVHEVGEHQGFHYFSMDYIEGRDLAEIVRENPLPARMAATYVKSIAEAVHYAHQQGTLHRDLKPSNVLIDGEDRVHVTDFGLAGRIDGEGDLTRTGQILGTPSYMPPEQAQGNRGLVGPASDVYSLGATLYCLLTARPPFRAESSVETLQQVIETQPVSPRLLNPTVPRDLETICQKCLRKEPAKRYATAAALAEDLGRWLRREPIVARPVSRAEKAWLWCRRRPAVAGAIAAILLTVCLAAGLSLVERQRHRREQIATAVTSIARAEGVTVPFFLRELDQFPPGLVLAELQKQSAAADDHQRLALAYARARFGDVHIDFLVSQIDGVPPTEAANMVTALGNSRERAVTALELAARAVEIQENWPQKARLAMVALHLEAPSLARDMCRLRPDPVQRTWFIEECSTWHGDLTRLIQLVVDCDDVPLCTAVVLAAGGAPQADVTVSHREAWAPVLSDWFRNRRDTLTHSAAGWTLRQWNLALPEIPKTMQPAENRDWCVNPSGMTMLLVPSGKLVRRDDHAGDDAIEQTVELTRDFLISDCEVTHGLFQEFLEDPGCPDAEKPDEPFTSDSSFPFSIEPSLERFSPTRRHPVHSVSWFDAIKFCNWMSHREGLIPCYERTGYKEEVHALPPLQGRVFDGWRLVPGSNGYRLPTEAEWEYVCRAGTVTTFSHGSDRALLDRYAVLRSNQTEVVGSRLPNSWGFFDVHGNLAEWCNDRSGPYGGQSIVVDPSGSGLKPQHPVRGGCFYNRANNARSSYRSAGMASYARTNLLGFRVARTLAADPSAASSAAPGVIDLTENEPDAVDTRLAERIRNLTQQICEQPTAWRQYYELAALHHFVGDREGYRYVCRALLHEFMHGDDISGRHDVLMTHLFFPGSEQPVTILNHAREHADENENPVNRRMVGLALCRLGRDAEALENLEEAVTDTQELPPDSRIVSLLCLALVQLRMEDLEAARETVGEAGAVHEESPANADSSDRQPWGVIPSMWREVQAAMEAAGIEEPIPELPPTYAEWAARSAAAAAAAAAEE